MFADRAEKDVIKKERLSGTYRLSAYWLSKMSAELPMVLVTPFLIWTLIYLLVGLPHNLTLYLTNWAADVLGSFMAQVREVLRNTYTRSHKLKWQFSHTHTHTHTHESACVLRSSWPNESS